MAKVRLLHGKPLMVGGKVALSDDCCCGGPTPPPFNCPDNLTAPTITITFAGLDQCFPDPSSQPPDALLNGSFTLLNVGSGQWFGGIIYCRDGDNNWRVSTEPCLDGEEQHNRDFNVICSGDFMSVFDVYDGGAAFFVNPSGTPPTIPNTGVCGITIGENGTATITVP